MGQQGKDARGEPGWVTKSQDTELEDRDLLEFEGGRLGDK